jgi:uncharacterized membrane protein HdeD (DUF308 family)
VAGPAGDSAAFPKTAYPALFQAAAAASAGGRQAYTRLIGLELLLLILGAALGAAAAFEAGLAAVLPMLAAMSFVAAAVLKVVSRERGYDRQWFDGRAVAEAVRSATWRYMMRVPPFDDDATADAAVTAALRRALEARPGLLGALATGPGETRQISPEMRAARGRTVKERLAAYRVARIGDQIAWYRRKGRSHRRRSTQFFWLSLAAQLAAIGAAGLAAADPSTARFNVLGLLAAIAMAATAVSQLNRNDELSRTYGLALQELSLIDGLAEGVQTEAELATIVTDVESAISREHTLWLAKGKAAGH